ncbi:MAG: F0F1 ATP synthase subunit gamma [Acidiferrobacterales bacterium]
MTHRRDLERHRDGLSQIREIMNSMKTLAYMETRKLSRFLNAQQAVVHSIDEVAADFISYFPQTLPEAKPALTVYLLIGTERGFCGNFNHILIQQLDSLIVEPQATETRLIAVGHKLHGLLQDDPRLTAAIDGASTTEEVTAILNKIVPELSSLQDEYGALELYCCSHGQNDELVTQRLLPPFQHHLHQRPRHHHPPVLNLPADDFLVELTEQYLFAALHEILYTSLMQENEHRVAHLERAVRRLDDEAEDLTRKCNALRQEEIVEEIEVILLSASSLVDRPGH